MQEVLDTLENDWLSPQPYIDLVESKLQKEREQMIGFYKWMIENDTAVNAEKYFHFSEENMLTEYLNKSK